MDEKHLLETAGIDAEDWEKTPASVRQLVVQLGDKIEQLEQHLKELQGANQQLNEKVNRNSKNSHSPPACCGEKLTGFDPNPYRHQVVEIPPIQLHIEEHRLHQLTCIHCGEKTRAVLPVEVEESGYGERLVAIVSVLSGMYRHSHGMVVSAMSDLFGVKMSLGTVNRLRREGSEAVSEPVEEAKAYIQSAPIVGADETGFGQGNTDGNNPQNKRAWLWVAVTPLVSFFQVMLSRSTAAAQYLLGESRERDSQQ